ncbi:MAG: SRPBCC family protein [Ktedonobacterales bacterium]
MPTEVRSVITINRPPTEVFDLVTTPGHWPDWHPSSLGVSGATDHSLVVDEEVTEEFLVAGRRGSLTWRVTQRDAPRSWAISGSLQGRGAGTVAYALTPEGMGTRFERVFTYEVKGLLFALVNRLAYHRRVVAESAEALRRLKRRLEDADS